MTPLNLTAEQQTEFAMLSMNFTMYFDGKKSRVDMTLPEIGDVIAIMDSTKNEALICMDMMGQKIALVQPMEAAGPYGSTEMDFTDGTFKLLNESKTIAGHPCKKAIWSSNDKSDTTQFDIWYATDTKNNIKNYGTLPGMPMEYEFNANGFSMRYTITYLKEEEIDDSLFEIPEGYKRTTAAELGMPQPGKN